MKDQLKDWQSSMEKFSAEDILRFFLDIFQDRITLASSLGAEDQVLTHMVLKINPKARIFVLDTGRLPNATYETMSATQSKLNAKYEVYAPNQQDLESLVNQKGINLFYESVENRKACCFVRKVEPLQRALSSCDAWITGIRRAQSITRATMKQIEWDDSYDILKLNPLAYWSQSDVWDYIKDNQIPYHPYHDQGYPSIGCEPCTRAIQPGEDSRPGRWWWEAPETKECGLHLNQKKESQ